MISKEEFILKFTRLADEHRNDSFNGDYKSANKAYFQLVKVFNSLDSDTEWSPSATLNELLDSDNPNVSTWAATFSLARKENIKKAENLLQKVASSKDLKMLAFNAEMTLKVWKEQGYLKIGKQKDNNKDS